MNINIIYDPSVDNAPAGFKAAIADAVAILDSALTTPVTVNVTVGFGEVDGQPLSPGALGESANFLTWASYGRILSALDTSLSGSDPTNGGQVIITTAEAKALGILPANGNIDGFVGFSNTAPFTYDPNNRAVAGEFDFIAVVQHEISEVLGRISMLDYGSVSTLDLFRYSAPGVHSLETSQPAYFSIDGGITNLNNFNTNIGGDLGDWAASAGNDAALAFSKPGVENTFSSTDITVMRALGFGELSPIIAISSAGGITSQPVQMISGTVDLEHVGTTVTLFDGATQIGTAEVQADGNWAIGAVLSSGTHILTAQDVGGAGSVGTSAPVNYTINASAPLAGVLESLTPGEEITAIYVGYFNRAPDPGGFAFWENQFTAALGKGLSADHTLTAIANSFAPQPETLDIYPFLTSGPLNPASLADIAGVQTLVASIYTNLFDRVVNAGSDSGAQYWVHAILDGQAALGQAILDIANGATGADAQVLLNKVIAGTYFAAETAAAGLGQSAVSANLVSAAHTALVGIGHDPTTVGVAEANIDMFVHA